MSASASLSSSQTQKTQTFSQVRYPVHLVGSVPLRDAAEVFETCAEILGSALMYLPDGEVDREWMGWLVPILAEHPQLEPDIETFLFHSGHPPLRRFRIGQGIPASDIRFDNLRHVDVALSSYDIFRRLKREQKIPAQVRFLYSLATPWALLRFVRADQQDLIYPAYEQAVISAVQQIAEAIPNEELAIQWDFAPEMTTIERAKFPERAEAGSEKQLVHHFRSPQELISLYGRELTRLGNALPEKVHLIYHLCYGDAGHRHSIEPDTTANMVEIANLVSRDVKRTIELIHMPVPKDRDDDAYFQPLNQLTLRPETKLCLGIVHYTDGVEGTERRLRTANRYASGFAIATECGFGRRAPETIPGLLRIHAKVAGLIT